MNASLVAILRGLTLLPNCDYTTASSLIQSRRFCGRFFGSCSLPASVGSKIRRLVRIFKCQELSGMRPDGRGPEAPGTGRRDARRYALAGAGQQGVAGGVGLRNGEASFDGGELGEHG
jgi:hypothetical protein